MVFIAKTMRDLDEVLDKGRCVICGDIVSTMSDLVSMVSTHQTHYPICSSSACNVAIKTIADEQGK